MATNLKELINNLNGNDIPTNIFTIEDEDPYVILGKLNEVIAYLESLQATINASDSKASEALTNANEALRQCIEAVKYAEEAFKEAETAEEKSQLALDATKVLEELVPRVEEALSQLEETNNKIAIVEEKVDNVTSTATNALESAENAVNKANDAVSKAEQAIIDNTTQDGKILRLETKNTEQDNLIDTLTKELKKEADTRSSEDADIRDYINRLESGGSELNEEILQQVNELNTNKADKTETNTRLATIDTEISNIKTKNTQQDTRLTAVETKNTAQDLEISNIKTKDTQQDTRLTAVENKATTNANEIDAIHSLTDTMQDDITQNANGIKALQTRATNIETKNKTQDTNITNLTNRVKANKDDIVNITNMLSDVEEDVSTTLPNKDIKSIGLTIKNTTNPNTSQNRTLSIVPVVTLNDNTKIEGNTLPNSIAFSTTYFTNRGGTAKPYIDISDFLNDIVRLSTIQGDNNFMKIKDPNSTSSIEIFISNVLPNGSSNKITFPKPFKNIPYVTGIAINNTSTEVGTILEVENITKNDVTFHGTWFTKSGVGRTGGDIKFTLIAISLIKGDLTGHL